MAKDPRTMMLPIELPAPNGERGAVSCVLVKETEKMRQVFICNAKVLEYEKSDRFYNNVAIAIASKLCYPKVDIADAFDVSRNTVTRIANDVETLGLEGAIDGREGPSGPSRRTPDIMKQVALLARKGLGPTEIHTHLQGKRKKKKRISLRSVYRCLAEIREREKSKARKHNHEEDSESPEQLEIPVPDGECGEEENSLEAVLFAKVEETAREEDAAAEGEKGSCRESVLQQSSEPISTSPPFKPEQGKSISYAGAFFAWPYLSLLGLLPLVWQLYGGCLKAKGKLYGLMHSISSFFFLHLLGFETVECLKVVDREGFRRLIGAISAPTVKTLRGKLGVISSFRKGYEFLMGLARRYCAMGMLELGVLYLDGHFIPYFGKREMGKGYYTLRRLAHPGRTQHFVNGHNGRPLFFLLREANESFVKIIPELVKETHELIGKQQLTFVFDRGGQSGALFKALEDGGDSFITYKKGKFRSMPGGAFRPYTVTHYRWGEKFEKTYDLWEGTIKITGYGNARLILAKKKNGQQTPIITNDWDRPIDEIASLMFNRWRQENFFKYMAANCSLDELVTQEEHPTKVVRIPNPRWHELEKKIRDARKKIAVMERSVGKSVSNCENQKTYDDERANPFITKVAALKRMKKRLKKLRDEQKQCPKEVSPSEIGQAVRSVIPQEGKIILDAVKLAVYNAEEWLLEIVQSHYRDWRDPRAILRMILQQKGDITVKDDVVKVTLQKFGKPSYQKAARGLCETLTSLEARSWDGRWRFEYEVAE